MNLQQRISNFMNRNRPQPQSRPPSSTGSIGGNTTPQTNFNPAVITSTSSMGTTQQAYMQSRYGTKKAEEKSEEKQGVNYKGLAMGLGLLAGVLLVSKLRKK
jgi:hypothetical protein